MIEYFNIPDKAFINMPISKKLFAEKAPLSAGEKRLLREEIEKARDESLATNLNSWIIRIHG